MIILECLNSLGIICIYHLKCLECGKLIIILQDILYPQIGSEQFDKLFLSSSVMI